VHTPVAVVGDLVKERLGQVQVSHRAARAAVNDAGHMGLTVGTSEGQLATTERVQVRVATGRHVLVEHLLRDSNDGVAVHASATTGSHASSVVGEVTTEGGSLSGDTGDAGA